MKTNRSGRALRHQTADADGVITTNEDRVRWPSRQAMSRGPLHAGSRAPAIVLRSSAQRQVDLDDYRGRPVVLVFYIADWHPVCSAQLQRYRDIGAELEELGAELLAISADTVWSHAAFASVYQLPFPVLADDSPRARIARAYGAYDFRLQMPRRALFVVDGSARITWSQAFPDAVDPGSDGILTALEELRSAISR